jgi:hypothetical protein
MKSVSVVPFIVVAIVGGIGWWLLNRAEDAAQDHADGARSQLSAGFFRTAKYACVVLAALVEFLILTALPDIWSQVNEPRPYLP